MVRTEYSLVKSNFIFQGAPPHARIPWRIFHGYHGIFPGEYSMVITEYSLENIPWLRRNIPWSNQILFSKGPTPHARIPWRIFNGYDGIFPGEYSMVKTEYSLVKSNFIFQGAYPPRENSLENIPWLPRNIPWRIFHG